MKESNWKCFSLRTYSGIFYYHLYQIEWIWGKHWLVFIVIKISRKIKKSAYQNVNPLRRLISIQRFNVTGLHIINEFDSSFFDWKKSSLLCMCVKAKASEIISFVVCMSVIINCAVACKVTIDLWVTYQQAYFHCINDVGKAIVVWRKDKSRKGCSFALKIRSVIKTISVVLLRKLFPYWLI